MKKARFLIAFTILTSCVSFCFNSTASAATADNWPQWRGPFFNGTSLSTNLPATWSKDTNVKWTTPLPGKSGSTPVVWGDNIFLSTPDENDNLLLYCIGRETGETKWTRLVVEGGNIRVGKNNFTSPSPVTDGERVIVMFGTGDLAAFDFNGNELWSRNLCEEYGKFAFMWLYGSSPLLFDNKLYIEVLQRTPPTYSHAKDDKPERDSFLLCLNPETGENIWRQLRETDAVRESMEAYTTPLPYTYGGRTALVVVGGDCVTGHDPKTGEELWRWSGLNPRQRPFYRIITSPAAAPGHIYASEPKGGTLFALRVDNESKPTVAWTMEDVTPDVCTPLYYEGKLYVLDGDDQIMSCMKPQTGEVFWRESLGVRETFSASPTGADGKIYCLSERGTVIVLSTGDEFEKISEFAIDARETMSSIITAGDQLFVRTHDKLYCIE